MKHAKKLSAIIMSVVLLLSAVSLFSTAYACDGCGDDEYHQSGMWEYTLENDEAIITGLYNSDELKGAVNVPEVLDGYSVTGIEWISYWNSEEGWNTEIDLYIPASIIKLTNPDGCEFGDGIRSITVDEANLAFSSENGVLFNKDKTELVRYPQNKAGTAYIIPSSVTLIGEGALLGCCELENITIPDSVTSIKSNAFGWCESLKSITLPNSLTTIGDYAFSGCTFTSIKIPAGVASIGKYVFNSCENLNSISVDENNQHYSSEDGILFSKDKATLVLFPFGKEATSYTVPDGVTTIGHYAFDDCYGLESITFPDSLATIGHFAFDDCPLTRVDLPESIKSIGFCAFGWTDITKIYIPASIEVLDYRAFDGCYDLEYIYFGGSRTQWDKILSETNPDGYYGGNYVIDNTYKYFDYKLETASGSCGTNATWFYDGIDTLTISGTGAMASYPSGKNAPWNEYADNIQVIEIEEGIAKIDGFYSCSSLETIVLPESLEYIESCAFCWNWDDIMKIIYKGMPEQWNDIYFATHDSDACLCYCIENQVIYIDNEDFTIESITLTADGSTTVKYGETRTIYTDIPATDDYRSLYFLPVGTQLNWYGENDNYFNGYTYYGDEYRFYMTSENSGTSTITVCLEDEDGWTIYNDDGEPIEASIELTSKAGIFEIIAYFFREMFNILFGWLMF